MLLQFFCLSLVLANGGKKHGVNAELPRASEGIEKIIKFWFPEDAKFDESCVSGGCPALNNFSLCPKDINITVLYAVLNTAVGCMRKPICGILIDSRPILGVPMSTEEWLLGMEIDGTSTTLPGTGYLTNVSSIEFGFLPDHKQTHQLPVTIPMFIRKMRAFGNFKLELSLRSVLPSILGQPLSITIPQAKYDIDVQYFSTIVMNQTLTDNNYYVKLLNPILKTEPVICGLDIPDHFPTIQTMFTSMSKVLTENSSWAVRQAVFLAKYFQSAIRTASNRC